MTRAEHTKLLNDIKLLRGYTFQLSDALYKMQDLDLVKKLAEDINHLANLVQLDLGSHDSFASYPTSRR